MKSCVFQTLEVVIVILTALRVSDLLQSVVIQVYNTHAEPPIYSMVALESKIEI